MKYVVYLGLNENEPSTKIESGRNWNSTDRLRSQCTGMLYAFGIVSSDFERVKRNKI